MAKKKFLAPFVVLTGGTIPGDDQQEGWGSADLEVGPCTFQTWLDEYDGEDIAGDGSAWDDFCDWWLENGFSWKDWLEFNPADEWCIPNYPSDHP